MFWFVSMVNLEWEREIINTKPWRNGHLAIKNEKT